MTCQLDWTVNSGSSGEGVLRTSMAATGVWILYCINTEIWNSFGQETDKMRRTFFLKGDIERDDLVMLESHHTFA